MAYTQESIFNSALTHLGVSATIQNLQIKNVRTIVLKNQYDLAKEVTMKSFDWGFLNRVKELTPSLEPSNDPRFRFAYDYPNDCLFARYLIDVAGGKYKKFEVSTDSSGQKVLLCNISPAKLSYTRKLVDVQPEAFFTAEFVLALSYYLAYLCADAITGSANKKQTCLQGYQLALANAKAINANESSENDEDNTTYLDSRN